MHCCGGYWSTVISSDYAGADCSVGVVGRLIWAGDAHSVNLIGFC